MQRFTDHQGWRCDRCGKQVKPGRYLYNLLAFRDYGLVCFRCGDNFERKQAYRLSKDIGGQMDQIRRISEVASDGKFEVDEFVKIDDVLDTDLTVLDIGKRQGQYGGYLTVKAKVDDKVVGFNTGSQVLLKALNQVKDEGKLPVVASISKVQSFGGQYYYIIR